MELGEEYRRPTTKWVKGELLDSVAEAAVDPFGRIAAEPGLSPFERLPWFARVARYWEGDCRPIVAHAWNGGAHCWLFMAHQGDRMTSLSNWYSLAFRPVFTGGQDKQLLSALARRIGKSPSIAPSLCLTPVPRSDGTSDLILEAFSANGWFAFRRQCSTSWTVEVAGKSFDQYWAERPGELRNTYRRKAKKSAIVSQIYDHFDEAAWNEYVAVYSESWKPEETTLGFLRDMAEAKSQSGSLRLGIARLDGKAIAAQLWIVYDEVAYIHKLAHRSGFEMHSPGTILSHDMFRHAIDTDRVRLIDFGTGNSPYKAYWMDRSAPLDTILLFKKSHPLGWTGAAREQLSSLVAPLRKS